MTAHTGATDDNTMHRLLDRYRSEGAALVSAGLPSRMVDSLLVGSGSFRVGPCESTSPERGDSPLAFAAAEDPPLEVVDFGAEDLRAIVRRAGVPVLNGGSVRDYLELPHGGHLVVTSGLTAAELGQRLGPDLVVVDRVIDVTRSSAIAISIHPECREEVVRCAIGLLQAAQLAVAIVPDIPGLVAARVAAVLTNTAEAGAHLEPDGITESASEEATTFLRSGIGTAAWSQSWGKWCIVDLLDSLRIWYGDEGYLATPSLRHAGFLRGGTRMSRRDSRLRR